MKVIQNQFLIFLVGMVSALALTSCGGGGANSAGAPLLGSKATMSSTITTNPSGTVTSGTPVTVTYHLKDKYGDGVPNELVLFAVGGTASGTYQCLTTQNVPNPGCASTTDASGNASVVLKASVAAAVSIQVTGALVPPGTVTPPISVASAVSAPYSTQVSFTYSP